MPIVPTRKRVKTAVSTKTKSSGKRTRIKRRLAANLKQRSSDKENQRQGNNIPINHLKKASIDFLKPTQKASSPPVFFKTPKSTFVTRNSPQAHISNSEHQGGKVVVQTRSQAKPSNALPPAQRSGSRGQSVKSPKTKLNVPSRSGVPSENGKLLNAHPRKRAASARPSLAKTSKTPQKLHSSAKRKRTKKLHSQRANSHKPTRKKQRRPRTKPTNRKQKKKRTAVTRQRTKAKKSSNTAARKSRRKSTARGATVRRKKATSHSTGDAVVTSPGIKAEDQAGAPTTLPARPPAKSATERWFLFMRDGGGFERRMKDLRNRIVDAVESQRAAAKRRRSKRNKKRGGGRPKSATKQRAQNAACTKRRGATKKKRQKKAAATSSKAQRRRPGRSPKKGCGRPSKRKDAGGKRAKK